MRTTKVEPSRKFQTWVPIRGSQILEIRRPSSSKRLLSTPRLPSLAHERASRERTVVTSQLVNDGIDLILGDLFDGGVEHGGNVV